MRSKKSNPKAEDKQRTYYVAAEYIDHGDRLLVEDGTKIELYSMDLKLAQHWYAAAWRGRHFDLEPFKGQCIAWDMEPKEAEQIKSSGLVPAECLRHSDGMPVVEECNAHPVYGSAVDILIGEVFEAALGNLIEQETGIAGLTISPMHTGYALHEGRPVGKASIDTVARSVVTEQPNLAMQTAPDGTVTILFSDIVGSTEINEHLGDARWMELLLEHNEIVRREKAFHRGYEVKTIGDAFMLAFQSARVCAVAIQRAFSAWNKTAKPLIGLRIGLHVGELVREDDDFFGQHVNYAARVASKAGAGEILVSSLLREVVEPSGEFSFVPQRPQALKGFRGKHRRQTARSRPRVEATQGG
jgi:class 3 adenylate cyclase